MGILVIKQEVKNYLYLYLPTFDMSDAAKENVLNDKTHSINISDNHQTTNYNDDDDDCIDWTAQIAEDPPLVPHKKNDKGNY